MTQDTDFYSLYSILLRYAKKNHSPTIEVKEFIEFLEQYAKHHADEHPEWMSWSTATCVKFWEELKRLTDAGTCGFLERGKLHYVYLPKYCATLINNAYQASFEPPEDEWRIPPFPNEVSLRISLPEKYFTFIKIEELAKWLEQEHPDNALFCLNFSNALGSILFPGSMACGEFLEAALVRARCYLVKGSNQEFFQQKLGIHFHGREDYSRDILSKLANTPRKVAEDIKEGGDASYLLWIFFCGEIRNDLEVKSSLSIDDSTALQSAYIIEQFNAFYNKIAQIKKDKEQAFKELLDCFTKTPYLFNLGQIIKFVGSNNLPLLGRYTQQELTDHLRELTSVEEEGESYVPSLVLISDKSDKQWYILKRKLPLLCIRYLLDAQPVLKSTVVDRWEEMLLECESEEAMTDAHAFEALLWRYAYSLIPPLAMMLEYKRLFLLYTEMDKTWEGYTEFTKLFNKDMGKLYPLSVLLFLKQKDLLGEAHGRLAFWYMFPFVLKIIAFFRGQKKQRAKSQRPVEQSSKVVSKEGPVTIKSVCSKLEAALVPEGYTPEWYLIRLYEKWSKPLKENEKQNLMEVVNALIRNRIRRNAPLYRPSQIDEDFLSETADGLIENSLSLRRLEQDSLKQYIKLYTLKLLRNMRV
jgi:hypothetical protein